MRPSKPETGFAPHKGKKGMASEIEELLAKWNNALAEMDKVDAEFIMVALGDTYRTLKTCRNQLAEAIDAAKKAAMEG